MGWWGETPLAGVQMVHSLALLDPVCLMTCAPHLVANFVYRPPPSPPLGRLPTGLEVLDLGRWWAARDLSIAATFCRGCAPPLPLLQSVAILAWSAH